MAITDEHFQNKYGYVVFKNNSLSQLLLQAEVDAIGISMVKDDEAIYAVDVAFHESGLNYGDRQITVIQVLKKIIRTAMCLVCYFGITKGEIVFASPKIHNSVLNDLCPCIEDLNILFLVYLSTENWSTIQLKNGPLSTH